MSPKNKLSVGSMMHAFIFTFNVCYISLHVAIARRKTFPFSTNWRNKPIYVTQRASRTVAQHLSSIGKRMGL